MTFETHFIFFISFSLALLVIFSNNPEFFIELFGKVAKAFTRTQKTEPKVFTKRHELTEELMKAWDSDYQALMDSTGETERLKRESEQLLRSQKAKRQKEMELDDIGCTCLRDEFKTISGEIVRVNKEPVDFSDPKNPYIYCEKHADPTLVRACNLKRKLRGLNNSM